MHQILDRTTQPSDIDGRARRRRRRRFSRCATSRARCRSRKPVQALRDPPDARHASGIAVRDAARQEVRALRRQPARGAGARAGRQDPRAHAAATRSSRSRTSAPSRCPRCGIACCSTSKAKPSRSTPTPSSSELLACHVVPDVPRTKHGDRGAPIRRRLPQEARVPARRLEARVRRAESRRSAGAQARPRPRVRRPSPVLARRRLPPHRLEGLQAAEPAAAAAVRRRAGPADLPVHRREPVDGASRRSSIRRGASRRRSATSASRISIA